MNHTYLTTIKVQIQLSQIGYLFHPFYGALSAIVFTLFAFYFRYFLLSEKGEKVEMQLGIARTNCIDCLDRTNVTQVTFLV